MYVPPFRDAIRTLYEERYLTVGVKSPIIRRVHDVLLLLILQEQKHQQQQQHQQHEEEEEEEEEGGKQPENVDQEIMFPITKKEQEELVQIKEEDRNQQE